LLNLIKNGKRERGKEGKRERGKERKRERGKEGKGDKRKRGVNLEGIWKESGIILA
jgi:hypothetical protein